MPHKPIPERQPFCTERQFKLIDPIWLHGRVPNAFWDDKKNRRNYGLWLGYKLSFRRMVDWYRLKSADFYRYGGSGIAKYWATSPIKAVKDCFPEYDWHEWQFAQLPEGFWADKRNRARYLSWLGARLGYKCRDDWYRVLNQVFQRNYGSKLLRHYGNSPSRAIMATIPWKGWCEWKFHHVPKGFWNIAENRRRYLKWLGRQLGYRSPTDWYQIRDDDFQRHGGTAIARSVGSIYALMREFLPHLDWNEIDPHQSCSIEQILESADAYHAQHGKWPTAHSGRVSGTNVLWSAIDNRLKHGFRGLPCGSSLSKLLKQRRGVHPGRHPMPLSQKQILRWADAYFTKHGKWPKWNSGRIANTEETWLAINHALTNGGRGLSRGLSLPQLLAKHRGVRTIATLPKFAETRIIQWARSHRRWIGVLPTRESGAISESPGDTWCAVEQALKKGLRGLPGGSSVYRLLHNLR